MARNCQVQARWVPEALGIFAIVAAIALPVPTVAAGDNGAGLSHGQVVGIVVGSVAGGVFLLLAACLCCCFYMSSRRRQTGDLTWAKTTDLEADAVAYAPQPGPLEPSPHSASSSRRVGAGGSGGGAKPVLPVAVAAGDGLTPLETAVAAASWQDNTVTPQQKQPPRSGGGMAHFLLGRRTFSTPRRIMSTKEKNLEVSQSARVEPSAEVELATPFEPASTNHGPPLSKSSMLLRWLHSAEDEEADAVAAQLAAAAAAVASSAGSPGSAGKASSALGKRGSPIGLSPFSDRLPLLSLAAQQTGIVWSKMPPSVASSPAVSVTEGSMSRHMLKGSWKRSDAPEDRISPGGALYSGLAGTHLETGDDRYPASMSRARVDSLGGRPQQRTGIVFDHVPIGTPCISRTSTISGGAASRPPTFGGAVLPMPPSAAPSAGATGQAAEPTVSAAALQRSLEHVELSFQPVPTAAPAAAQRVKGGWDQAVDARAFAQATRDVQQHGEDQAQPSPWLHQVPSTQLAALQEEEEEHAEVTPEPVPRPDHRSQAYARQLAPTAVPVLARLVPTADAALTEASPKQLLLAVAPAPSTSGDAQVTWIRFSNDGGSRPIQDPVAPSTSESPVCGARESPFLQEQQPLPAELPAPDDAGLDGPQAVQAPGAVPAASKETDRHMVVSIGGGIVPSLSRQPSEGHEASPIAANGGTSPTAARALALRRRAALPPPMMRPASRSGGGSRSPTSVSPSMGMHFPDLRDAWEEPPVQLASQEAEAERQRSLARSKSSGTGGLTGTAVLRRNGSGGSASVRGKGSRGGGRMRSGSGGRLESPTTTEFGGVPPSPSSSQGNRF